jgi:hypothetical protein
MKKNYGLLQKKHKGELHPGHKLKGPKEKEEEKELRLIAH